MATPFLPYANCPVATGQFAVVAQPYYPAYPGFPCASPGSSAIQKPVLSHALPDQFLPKNQPPVAPLKNRLQSGIDHVKKTAFWNLLFPFVVSDKLYPTLGKVIMLEKIPLSAWKPVVGEFATNLTACIVASFSIGACKNKKEQPAADRIESGFNQVRTMFPGLVSLGVTYPLLSWLTQPTGKKTFLPYLRQNLPIALLLGPAILAVEFGIGAYQFGKPHKDENTEDSLKSLLPYLPAGLATMLGFGAYQFVSNPSPLKTKILNMLKPA